MGLSGINPPWFYLYLASGDLFIPSPFDFHVSIHGEIKPNQCGFSMEILKIFVNNMTNQIIIVAVCYLNLYKFSNFGLTGIN